MVPVYQGYKNLIIGVFISNILFSQIAVSDETISDLYLGDDWVHQIQISPQNNYRLENGDLFTGESGLSIYIFFRISFTVPRRRSA